jgi:hypothetical protein
MIPTIAVAKYRRADLSNPGIVLSFQKLARILLRDFTAALLAALERCYQITFRAT